MTLIASTLNFKKPFVMSDLVWSSSQCDDPIIMPTNSFDLRPHLPLEQEEKPVRLYQKMYFVKDKTCIVFAGFSEEIKTFLIVIKYIFRNHEKISMDEMHEFLKGYNLQTKFLESAFFIMNIENLPNGSINVGQFNCPSKTNSVDRAEFNISEEDWNEMHNPIFDKVSACGSGAEGYLNIVNQESVFYSRFEDGNFMKAVQSNTTLIAKLLTLERVSLYTLKKNWGGGFEAAYYNGEKFEKIADIAYVVCHSQFDNSGGIGMPVSFLIMYYKYINGILYIVSLEAYKYTIQDTENYIVYTSANGSYAATLFEVEGLDVDDIHQYDLPSNLSFSTNKVAIGYAFVTKANTIFNPALFNLGPEIEVHFQQGSDIEIRIDKKIDMDIREMSKNKFPTLESNDSK